MRLPRSVLPALLAAVFVIAALTAFNRSMHPRHAGAPAPFDQTIDQNAQSVLQEGRETFRFDTFGDEAFWGGALMLHQAIEGASFGGVGPGLSPSAALAAGLKVDMDALPPNLQHALLRGDVNLNDPAVTLDLLRRNAVLGVTGFFSEPASSGNGVRGQVGGLSAVGIQCALCHSTVDNALAPGIGHRLDGWANRDLNVGAIVAMSPNLQPFASVLGVDAATVRAVLNSWGPGKFDAELILDGKAFRPDGKSAATLIPPAFGLAGVNLHTWTGWGSVPYWNAFVANLEMHGKGTFFDPRLDNAAQFPIAAAHGFGHISTDPDSDLISSKLPALHVYQLDIASPAPPAGSFDAAAADRGDHLFEGKARCQSCHVEGTHWTEPGWNMHRGSEIGIDDFQADRAPDHAYRTSPLGGLWTHMKGGFYHDGRFATLMDVVNHYNTFFNLGLTEQEKSDVVEYLKSLGEAPVNVSVSQLFPAVATTSRGGPGTRGSAGGDVLRMSLSQNEPNPFREATSVRFDLSKAAAVRLEIFDIQGRRVRVLVEGQLPAGSHQATWDRRDQLGRPAGPGIYFYRLQSSGQQAQRRMTLS